MVTVDIYRCAAGFKLCNDKLSLMDKRMIILKCLAAVGIGIKVEYSFIERKVDFLKLSYKRIARAAIVIFSAKRARAVSCVSALVGVGVSCRSVHYRLPPSAICRLKRQIKL